MATSTTKKTETKSKSTANKTETKKKTGTSKTKTETKKVEPKKVSPVKNIEEVPVVKIQEKRVYQSSDLISCKSVRYGTLQHVSKKSGNMYEWSDYGDIVEVEYGDLMALKARKSKFIFAPWFIILDGQLAEEWKLTDIYSYFEDFDDIEEFLQSGAMTIRRKLPNAPQGYKDLVTYTAGNMLRNGTLDSIATIKAVDEILHKNLQMLIGG